MTLDTEAPVGAKLEVTVLIDSDVWAQAQSKGLDDKAIQAAIEKQITIETTKGERLILDIDSIHLLRYYQEDSIRSEEWQKTKGVDYHIYLDKVLDSRLTAYIQKHYGDSRVRSAIIQRAVTEFLDHAGFQVKGKKEAA